MTAHKFPPPDDSSEDAPEAIPWYDSLRKLLEPYEPAESQKDADTFYSTQDIIQALELHFNVPQAESKKGYISSLVDGQELVDKMYELGYHFENTGDLQLQWLLRKKK